MKEWSVKFNDTKNDNKFETYWCNNSVYIFYRSYMSHSEMKNIIKVAKYINDLNNN